TARIRLICRTRGRRLRIRSCPRRWSRVAPHDVSHREEDAKQDRNHCKSAEQLPVAQYQFELARFVFRHKFRSVVRRTSRRSPSNVPKMKLYRSAAGRQWSYFFPYLTQLMFAGNVIAAPLALSES